MTTGQVVAALSRATLSRLPAMRTEATTSNGKSTCFDMHGETPPTPEVKVVTYQKGTGVASNGSVVAPFDGIHGWYLQNQAERPVTVRLELSGFWSLEHARIRNWY